MHRVHSLILVAVLLGGCTFSKRHATEPPVLIEPTVVGSLHAGTPLSGRTNQKLTLAVGDVSYNITLRARTQHQPPAAELRTATTDAAASPATRGQPLAQLASLITTTGQQDAFVPAANLTRLIRWEPSAPLGEHDAPSRPGVSAQAVSEAVLTARTTSVFTFEPERENGQPVTDSSVQRVTVSARLTSDPDASEGSSDSRKVRLAVALTREVLPQGMARSQAQAARENPPAAATVSSQAAQPGSASARRVVTETLVVDLPLVTQKPMGQLLIPLDPLPAVDEQPSQYVSWLLLTLQVSPVQADGDMLATANDQLAQSQALAVAASDAPQPSLAALEADMAAAVNLLAVPAQRRKSLLYLSSRSGAPLAGDAVLLGGDLFLEVLATRVQERAPQLQAGDMQGLAWMLDRACLEVFSKQSGQRMLRDLQGVFNMHLGYVASRPALLEELSSQNMTRQVFDTRLLAEHLVFLEDDQPSVRVIATRWLQARNQLPQGYDPLASAKSRRQALDAAAALREGAPADAGQTPSVMSQDEVEALLDQLDETRPAPAGQTPGTQGSPSPATPSTSPPPTTDIEKQKAAPASDEKRQAPVQEGGRP